MTGAFHSSMMEAAAEELADTIQHLPLSPPRVPIVLNTTASPTRCVHTIRSQMLRQVTSPVRWHQSVRWLERNGVREWVEIGHVPTLTPLINRSAKAAHLTAHIGTPDHIADVRARIGS